MKFASFVDRIAGEGSKAWEIHGRAARMKRDGEDVILLSIGDHDFHTAPHIIDAMAASAHRGRTHYMAVNGDPKLRAAVARQHAEVTGLEVDPEQVTIVPGAQCGLFAAARCVLESGDQAIVFDPTYTTYEAVVEATGAEMVRVPLRADHGFHLDPADLSAAITPKTKAILLNSPHNPTGAVATEAEIEAIAEVCRAHDLWLISDEVYASLCYDRPHLSPCALPGMAERTAVVSSLSKSHAMTGWRVGWVIGSPALTGHLENLMMCMLFGLPPFIQDAAVEALASGTAEMNALFLARRNLVCDRLAQLPELVCHRPESGMFVMIDIRGTGLTAMDFANRLLDSQGVSLLPGEGFGPAAQGHVRLSLAAEQDGLGDACNRITRFLRDLGRAAAS